MDYSIIIPSYGRPDNIKYLVEVLAAQIAQNPSGEIIVVDDGNEPPLNFAMFDNQSVITVIRSNRVGPGCARNLGVSKASGKLLFFIDDDCLPPSSWVMHSRELMNDSAIDMIGGAINNCVERPASVIYQKTLDLFFKLQGGIEFILTANMICRREVFLAVKGFDERFFHGAEDREFILRLRKYGYKVAYIPELCVSHFHSFSHRSLWSHTFMQAKGSYLLYTIVRKEQKYILSRLPLKTYIETAINFLADPGGFAGLVSLFSFIIMQLFGTAGFFYFIFKRSDLYAKKG